MIGGQLLISGNTPHTQNIQTTLLSLLQPRKGKDSPHHTVRGRPSTYSPPNHYHSQCTCSRQRLRDHSEDGTRGEARATQTPHTTGALPLPTRRFRPRETFPVGPGGDRVGCKMASAGTRTLLPRPSQPGSLFSSQESPLRPFRGASSCAGPGGRTWRNTCREKRGPRG